MKLTGQNVQQICDALLDAYPTRDSLRMMVRVELDRNLEEIAGGENQNVVVFNLVSWAGREGRCALRGSQDPGTAFDEDGFRVVSSAS